MAPKSAKKSIRSERGAALIHVGIAMFVLVAMSAFVLDFGVMWMARRQA
jgi:Flp pilus assembly protein TadG